MSLCSETQTGYGSYYARKIQESQDLKEGRDALIGLGALTATLAATVVTANFYARFFPTAPETKRINRRESALLDLGNMKDTLKILLDENANHNNKENILFATAESNELQNELQNENNKKLIKDMLFLIGKLESKIVLNIKSDTEKLKKRAELKKKRSWKEWWQGKHNTDDIAE